MKQIKLYLIGILAILVVSLLISNNAKPDFAFGYGIKRAEEKLFLNLQFSKNQKLDYLDYLLSERLKNLQYLTNNKKTYLLWQSSLRYSTTAGEITDFIIGNNLADKASQFSQTFKQHQSLINDLLTYYPGDLDPTEKNSKFLTDAINYLSQYIEKLSQL